MLLLLSIFLIFPTIQGCLVLRTPSCDCRAVAFTPSNYAATLGAHPFFSNVSGLPIITPVLNEAECYASMYCEDDYSLVIFDLETATVFGDFSAEGMCNSGSQTWLVDDGIGMKEFKRLFGICVDYRPPQPPTTPSSLDFCGCKGDLIDESNAQNLLGDGDFYKANLSNYQLVRPTARMEGCKVVVECPSGLTKLLIADAGWAFYGYEELTCEYNQLWTFAISEGGYEATVAYMVCVDFGAPEPSNPLENACGCKGDLIDDSNAQNLLGEGEFYATNLSLYQLVRPSAHMVECKVAVECPNGLIKVLITNRGGPFYNYEATCKKNDFGNGYWSVTTESFGHEATVAYMLCVDFGTPLPTTPSPLESCGCKADVIDKTNARRLIGQHDAYAANLSHYQLVKPSAFMQGCMMGTNCPSGHSQVVIGEDRWDVVTMHEIICPDNKKWNVRVLTEDGVFTYTSSFIYMTCVEFKPLPNPLEDACGCKANVIDDSNAQSLIGSTYFYAANLSDYQLVRPSARMSGCMINTGCPSGYSLVVIGDNRWNVVDLYEISCREDGKNWEVVVWDNGQVSYGSPFVYVTCVNFNNPVVIHPPTLPPPWAKCGCTGHMVDSENGLRYIGHLAAYSTLKDYHLMKPNTFVKTLEGVCEVDFECKDSTRILISENQWHELDNLALLCKNDIWEITPNNLETYTSPIIYQTCKGSHL